MSQVMICWKIQTGTIPTKRKNYRITTSQEFPNGKV
jgi:hypothetical protein